MPVIRLLAVALVAALLVACQTQEPEPPSQPQLTPRERAEQLRQQYQAVDPNVRVGVVAAVLPAERLAAVEDIPLADFQPGDALVFMTPDEQMGVEGIVRQVTDQRLIVRYDEPAAGERAPQEGDLVVRVPPRQ